MAASMSGTPSDERIVIAFESQSRVIAVLPNYEQRCAHRRTVLPTTKLHTRLRASSRICARMSNAHEHRFTEDTNEHWPPVELEMACESNSHGQLNSGSQEWARLQSADLHQQCFAGFRRDLSLPAYLA